MKRLNLFFRISILLLVPLWNSCILTGLGTNGECTAASTTPTNVVAVAGNGQATISWKVSLSGASTGVSSYVMYPKSGGLGSSCTTLELNADCTRGCNTYTDRSTSGDTSCTVTGLTNGTSYTFTVITYTPNENINCKGSGGVAYGRSAPVTPKAN
jgi:hypothetical protein